MLGDAGVRRRLAGAPSSLVGRRSVLAFLVVPVLSVIPMSFSSSMVFELIPSQPGLSQYRRFFESPEWMVALGRSLQVALGTTVVATVLGTRRRLGLARMRSRWRAVLEAALISSRIVPSIVFAVALYFVFSQAGLVGTITGLVLAHSVLAFPFVVVLGQQRALQLRPVARGGLEEPRRRAVPDVLPHHLPADPAGGLRSALFAFNVSFDEVVVTLFISGVRSKTVPVKVWDAILYEITPILPAISTLIIVISILLLTPLLLYRRRA